MFQFLGTNSLAELLFRADVRILLWLNHFIADFSSLQAAALFLSDRGSDILVFVALLALWFWPKNEQNRTLFGSADLTRNQAVPLNASRAWLQNVWLEDEYQPLVTRRQSRAQVLLWGFGAALAYILSRVGATQLDVSRPFASYWMGALKALPDTVPTLENIQSVGSFPSGHAAVTVALACALFFWNRRLGLIGCALAVLMAAGGVAVGLHFPKDILGGALLGLLCVWPFLGAYRRQGKLYRAANALADAFDTANAPYCYLLYFLLVLAGLEAAAHFDHVLQMLFALRGSLFQAGA